MRCIPVVLVALAIAFVVFYERDLGVVPVNWNCAYETYDFGWPMVTGKYQVSVPMIAAPGVPQIHHWEIDWSLMVVNFIVWLAIVVCTFLVARSHLPLVGSGRFPFVPCLVFATTFAPIVLLMAAEFAQQNRLVCLMSPIVGHVLPNNNVRVVVISSGSVRRRMPAFCAIQPVLYHNISGNKSINWIPLKMAILD